MVHVSSLLQTCKKTDFSGWKKCRYDGESANSRQTGGQKLLPTCLCVELSGLISSERRLFLRSAASKVVICDVFVLGLAKSCKQACRLAGLLGGLLYVCGYTLVVVFDSVYGMYTTRRSTVINYTIPSYWPSIGIIFYIPIIIIIVTCGYII